MLEKPNRLVAGLVLTPQEIELRKRWLEFSESDAKIVQRDVDPCFHDVEDLIDKMYQHFLSFEETSAFFADDKVLMRAQSAQKAYFRQLTKGVYDSSYVDDRLRVGSTHHRIDLDPKWYIGAYNRVLSWVIPRLIQRLANDHVRLQEAISAFMRLVFFDMGLALDCYIFAKETAIKAQRDAIVELETERRITKAVLEGAPVGIVKTDSELLCFECNQEFLEMVIKSDISTVINARLPELLPGFGESIFRDVLLTGQAQRGVAAPLVFGDKESRTYWDWAVWPVRDSNGELSGLIGMFANATDRVLLQQQREDFVATLTHDLKTPVSATNRAVQFLLDGDFGAVTDAQREILMPILQSNKALYNLVQTLLDVYKFDSGVKELTVMPTDLAAAITELVMEIMPLAQERGIRLEATLDVNADNVDCDEGEIRRVLQNLIDNALKFTPSGGNVSVVMAQTESTTIVQVVDTGRGVPEENKPKIFQRFWQAGSTGRYYASTGLGLYLCRRIVEAHRGKIWFKSKLALGSSFYFELPTHQQGYTKALKG